MILTPSQKIVPARLVLRYHRPFRDCRYCIVPFTSAQIVGEYLSVYAPTSTDSCDILSLNVSTMNVLVGGRGQNSKGFGRYGATDTAIFDPTNTNLNWKRWIFCVLEFPLLRYPSTGIPATQISVYWNSHYSDIRVCKFPLLCYLLRVLVSVSAPAGSRTSHLSITSPTPNHCTSKTSVLFTTSGCQLSSCVKWQRRISEYRNSCYLDIWVAEFQLFGYPLWALVVYKHNLTTSRLSMPAKQLCQRPGRISKYQNSCCYLDIWIPKFPIFRYPLWALVVCKLWCLWCIMRTL